MLCFVVLFCVVLCCIALRCMLCWFLLCCVHFCCVALCVLCCVAGKSTVTVPCFCIAPSAPVMNPQVVNSATTSSLRVCWSLFSDDTVDFYQLYCRQISEDITTETEQDGNRGYWLKPESHNNYWLRLRDRHGAQWGVGGLETDQQGGIYNLHNCIFIDICMFDECCGLRMCRFFTKPLECNNKI